MMLHSRTPRRGELHASVLFPEDELGDKLNVVPILKMLDRPSISTPAELLDWMSHERFVSREPIGGGYVTNLGAIAAARKLADFPDLSRKAVRIVVYDGLNKAKTKQEREGTKGYAISSQAVMEFVMSLVRRVRSSSRRCVRSGQSIPKLPCVRSSQTRSSIRIFRSRERGR